jgi:hypothetical protein
MANGVIGRVTARRIILDLYADALTAETTMN